MYVIGRTISKQISRRPSRHCRYALTLLEAMLAITILPMAVLAIAMTVTAGQSQSMAAMHQSRAATLAEAVMEEMIALPFADPDNNARTLGPEVGENKVSKFDNADDYCGETINAADFTDAIGDAFPETMRRFDVTTTCKSIAMNPLGVSTDGLEITITVTNDGTEYAQVTRFLVDPDALGVE